MSTSFETNRPNGVLFELLANRRRRMVIDYLQDHTDECPVQLQELSAQITSRETDTPPAEVSYQDRKSTYTALRQNHLPKLDEAELITFDEDRLTVAPTPKTNNASVYMEVVPDAELSWSNYYLLLSVFGTALLVANVLGIFPFSLVSTTYITLVILLLFMLSSIAQRMSLARRRFNISEQF
jgi:hypothetical protein